MGSLVELVCDSRGVAHVTAPLPAIPDGPFPLMAVLQRVRGHRAANGRRALASRQLRTGGRIATRNEAPIRRSGLPAGQAPAVAGFPQKFAREVYQIAGIMHVFQRIRRRIRRRPEGV